MKIPFEKAAITEDLDKGVGQLIKRIGSLGIAEDTYIVYMSDNGAGSRENYPLCRPITLKSSRLNVRSYPSRKCTLRCLQPPKVGVTLLPVMRVVTWSIPA